MTFLNGTVQVEFEIGLKRLAGEGWDIERLRDVGSAKYDKDLIQLDVRQEKRMTSSGWVPSG